MIYNIPGIYWILILVHYSAYIDFIMINAFIEVVVFSFFLSRKVEENTIPQ